jgi:hypothetical protein
MAPAIDRSRSVSSVIVSPPLRCGRARRSPEGDRTEEQGDAEVLAHGINPSDRPGLRNRLWMEG